MSSPELDTSELEANPDFARIFFTEANGFNVSFTDQPSEFVHRNEEWWTGADDVEQIIVEMEGGCLFVTTIADGSTLGVVADRDCDIGLIAYEMTLLCRRAGDALTPSLIAELKNPLAVGEDHVL